MDALPYVDRHTVEVAAPAATTWRVARSRLNAPLRGPAGWYARAVGVQSDRLFDVERAEEPTLLGLAGQHRFSRYRLTFTLEETRPGTTALTASTHAAFPGLFGRLYQLAVIDSGAHAVLTKRLLRGIARRAERR